REVYDAYKELHAALKTDAGQLRIPRALSYSAAHRLLLLEPAPGIPLSSLGPDDRKNAYLRLGEVLRKLHHLKPPSTTPRSTRLTPNGLAQAAVTIAQVRPEVAEPVQRLANELIAGRAQILETAPVLLHGDLHPKNVLMDNERLCLLDLDQ